MLKLEKQLVIKRNGLELDYNDTQIMDVFYNYDDKEFYTKDNKKLLTGTNSKTGFFFTIS